MAVPFFFLLLIFILYVKNEALKKKHDTIQKSDIKEATMKVKMQLTVNQTQQSQYSMKEVNIFNKLINKMKLFHVLLFNSKH